MSNCTKKVKTDECLKTRDDGYNQCTATRDDGYNRCNQTRDEGYSSCSDWGLFSFVCIAWTWVKNIVCVAWEWIQNIVCVAWEWVKNIVCVAWKYIVQFVCVVIDLITTILGAIVSVIDIVLGIVGGIISFLVDVITSIPIIGRFIEWVLNIIKSIIFLVIAFWAFLVDSLLTLIGIIPEKKLRLMVVIQSDENGNPLIRDKKVILRALQYVINIYREEVNVRVIPVKIFKYDSAFSNDDSANDDFIITEKTINSNDTLDVCCDTCEAGQNLLTRGSLFNLKISRLVFLGGGRRLLGIGSPVVAFAVRSFTDGKAGCSLGPLTDFVTVQFSDSDITIEAANLTADKLLGSITDLAHEVSHCCFLPHKDDRSNIMNPLTNRGGGMTVWQKILVRASRHVSYL